MVFLTANLEQNGFKQHPSEPSMFRPLDSQTGKVKLIIEELAIVLIVIGYNRFFLKFFLLII